MSATPQASGIECVRWISSTSNGPASADLADREHVEVDLAQLVLVELRAGHGDRELAAVDDRDARLPELAQHHGSAPSGPRARA